MTHIKILFKLCLLFVLTITINAQNNIPTNGGEATGSGGTISYTVGQVIYNTSEGNTGSITEGVQQPYEISTLSGVDQTEINLEISAYPNPTNDYLQINIEGLEEQDLQYQLYSVEGKLIKRANNISNQTQINMSGLMPSCYFLKIIQGNKEIKAFKIIKN